MRLVTVVVNLSLCASLAACATAPESKPTETPKPPMPKAVTVAKKLTPPKPSAKAVINRPSLNLAAMQGHWGLAPNALPFVSIEGQNFRWAKEKISHPLKIQHNALVGRVPAPGNDWTDSCLVNVSMRNTQLAITLSACTKAKINKQDASLEFFKVAAHSYTDFNDKSCKQLQTELDTIYQQARQAKAQVKKLEKAGKKLDEAFVKQDAERITNSMSILDAGTKQNCNLKVQP
jgi:ABC-type uncharacterized transport system auxiliary subunit